MEDTYYKYRNEFIKNLSLTFKIFNLRDGNTFKNGLLYNSGKINNSLINETLISYPFAIGKQYSFDEYNYETRVENYLLNKPIEYWKTIFCNFTSTLIANTKVLYSNATIATLIIEFVLPSLKRALNNVEHIRNPFKNYFCNNLNIEMRLQFNKYSLLHQPESELTLEIYDIFNRCDLFVIVNIQREINEYYQYIKRGR